MVRESDGLPGQGWWVGNADRLGYGGAWTGPEAAAFIASLQGLAFDRWGDSGETGPPASGSLESPRYGSSDRITPCSS